jgi:hypothetical protein
VRLSLLSCAATAGFGIAVEWVLGSMLDQWTLTIAAFLLASHFRDGQSRRIGAKARNVFLRTTVETNPNNPAFNDPPQGGSVPPPLPASDPPVAGAPPALAGASSAPPPNPDRQPVAARSFLAILLSLCLGLFLADAVVSLVTSSLSLFFGIDALSAIGGLVSFFALLIAVVVYGLMGLTPMIPKRLFLPLTLFYPVSLLASLPFVIYYYGRLQGLDLGLSLCQVILGLVIFCGVQGGLKFRWPLVAREQLEDRRFSLRNLCVFLMANVFVLLPAALVYLVLCGALAADHFSEGFVVLRPAGVTVRVRKYVRNDGKTIQLFPMIHVAESDFYRKVLQSFPTNSIILMEGVTDDKNLITNRVSYKRMAKALHLGEQHEEFKPDRGEMVRADVDVSEFTTNTIDVLNLVMFIHSKGLNAGTLLMLTQYKEPPNLQELLFDDLLKKRNRHLLEQIHARLSQSDHIIVPWGAAHMPELSKEILKSGFRLEDTQDYVAIRFHSSGSQGAYEKAK